MENLFRFVQYLEKFGVSLTKVDVAETEELFSICSGKHQSHLL